MSASKLINSSFVKHFPLGHFKIYENQRSFLVDLGKKLQFSTTDDWYKLSAKSIIANGGKMLLRQYKDSLASVVIGVFRDEMWRPWLFQSRVRLEWTEKMKLQYMEYCYEQLQFKSMEDWYTISSEDIFSHHGSALLCKYGNSPSRMVMEIFSDHPWQFWKFAFPPRHAWEDPRAVQQYMKYLGEQLGYTEMSHWYKISTREILAHHGEPLFRKYGRSLSRLVIHSIPDHPWLPFLFHSRKKSKVKLVEYVQGMEKEMGITKKEDWYEVERGQMRKMRHHFGDLEDFVANLQTVYPQHSWEMKKFKSFTKSATQHMLKELLMRTFPGREVVENYPHPFLFFPQSGEIMTVDVFVPSVNLAFDYNGEQHYKQVSTNRSATERQKLDVIKKLEFEKTGYKFVVVPCWWDGTIESLLPNIPATG